MTKRPLSTRSRSGTSTPTPARCRSPTAKGLRVCGHQTTDNPRRRRQPPQPCVEIDRRHLPGRVAQPRAGLAAAARADAPKSR
eukprot:5864026-Prymnesium_polylepis.2